MKRRAAPEKLVAKMRFSDELTAATAESERSPPSRHFRSADKKRSSSPGKQTQRGQPESSGSIQRVSSPGKVTRIVIHKGLSHIDLASVSFVLLFSLAGCNALRSFSYQMIRSEVRSSLPLFVFVFSPFSLCFSRLLMWETLVFECTGDGVFFRCTHRM